MKTNKKVRFGLALLAFAAPFLMMFSGGRAAALSPAIFKSVYSPDRPLLAAVTTDGAGGTPSTNTSASTASTTPTDPTVSTNSGNGCLNNTFGFSLAWLVCPVLDAASGLSNVLINIFETELQFTVGQLGNIKDPKSGIYKTRQTWSLVKDISSAILVIIMLIMVLSQAAGGGPFDAYTVRKLLPRLVAAVILMQISWDLFAWIIDLFNDLGKGLADIMAWPFGGPNQLSLFSLFANAKLDGVTGTAQLAIINWAAIGVGIALGIAYLFTMLGFAFVALIGLGFAVLTLVFRKILIIMLLIFSPLALLAWILPGTERYWKMWFDNFIKALAMFPLAVAIIYAGRIFAYIVGSQDNSEFLNMIFIIAGFFGPLFILPKTFQWGGAAMNAIGGRIMSASSKVSEKPKGYFDKRQEEYNHQKDLSAADRLREWDQGKLSRRQKFMSALRGDKFKAGDWDPAYNIGKARLRVPGTNKRIGLLPGGEEMGKQREDKMQRFRAASIRAENEEREYAKQKLEDEASHEIPGDRVSYYKQIWEGKRGHRSEAERFAALEMIGLQGGENGLEYLQNAAFTTYNNMYDTDADGNTVEKKSLSEEVRQENAAMDKLFDRNVPNLFAKLPHVPYYKGVVRAADGFNGDAVAQLSETGGRKIINDLHEILSSADASDDRKDKARGALENFYRAYQLAASSDTTKARISVGLTKAVLENIGGEPVPDALKTSVVNAAGGIQGSATATGPGATTGAAATEAAGTSTTTAGRTTAAGGGEGGETAAETAARRPGEQPQVNVNLNEEALGRSFARHMRTVLNETTLKIEHPTGEQGSGRFNAPPPPENPDAGEDHQNDNPGDNERP